MNKILPIAQPFIVYTLYLLLLFALACLLVVLAYILVISIAERKRKKDLEKESKEIHDDAYQEAMRILDEARVKSINIMGEAQIRAQKVLSEVTNLSTEAKNGLTKRIEALYLKQENILEQMGGELAKFYKEIISKEKIEIKKEAISNIEEFKDTMEKETIESQKEIEEKLKQSYEEVEKELADYKREKVSALNEKIFQVLADITEKIVGKSVDQTEHEKIILETLRDEIRKLGLGDEPSSNNQN